MSHTLSMISHAYSMHIAKKFTIMITIQHISIGTQEKFSRVFPYYLHLHKQIGIKLKTVVHENAVLYSNRTYSAPKRLSPNNFGGFKKFFLLTAYQLPNIKNSSSLSFKFVTMSKCGDQLAFYSRLKMKKWRKLEQHSIKNHSHMAQSAVQLTCIQEVVGLNPGGEQIFFLNINTFTNTFFRIWF